MSQRAKSAEDYAGLVDQVIFELEELLAATDFDTEAIDVNTNFLEILLDEVRRLRASMSDGSYLFGRDDLPFMRLVKKSDEMTLPFIRLFYQINETHKQGLEIPDD
ncbi:MAG: general secretion pathway protein GspF [Gammaproteobacteria bacterium]|nr:MAG: general secretion pathway protein GspF [Gammaproteobacteria bacterium]